MFAKSVRNNEIDIATVIESAGEHGTPPLVIDQPGSVAQLAFAVCRVAQVSRSHVVLVE